MSSFRVVAGCICAALVLVFGVLASTALVAEAANVAPAGPLGDHAPLGNSQAQLSPSAQSSGDPTIYDSTVNPLPGNLPSESFEATETSAFGNQVSFAGSARELNNVVVTMSSWACQSGNWTNAYGTANTCVTTPGTGFSEPITLNIYSVGANNAVGNLIGTDTQTFNIPYRPSSSDPSVYSAEGCTGGQWYDSTDNLCYNGLATNITFDFSSQNLVLPDNVIYDVAYNTSDYGANPYGDSTACHATQQGCGYDSLNVGLSEDPNNLSVGSDPNPGTVYWNTAYAPNYCDDGAGGTGTLRIDGAANTSTCWDGGASTGWAVSGTGSPYYVPAVQFNANPGPSSTVVVTPPDLVSGTPTASGQFVVKNESGGGGSVSIVSGPAGGPSAGSLRMSTSGTTDHWDAFNYDDQNVPLSTLSTLSYSDYTNNAPDYDPVFQLQADLSASIPFSTISYEPYEQTTPDTANSWQSFNVLSGLVWGTHIADTAPGGIDDPISWTDFVSDYPSATVIAVGADVGSSWPAMTGNVDALSIGTDGQNGSTTTYDFNVSPPTVSIAVPSKGATVSGNATVLDATATNATSVQFLLFGGQYGYAAPTICTTTQTLYGWLCSWDTTTVPNNTYALLAMATGPGGTTYSAPRTITVDNPPPTVNIVLPTNGATVSGTAVTLEATATNASSVQFLLFGGRYGFAAPTVCTATLTSAWSCSWNTTTVPDAQYTLVAEASGGGGTATAGVKIIVGN